MVVELPVKQMYNSSSHWALYSLKELKMAELKTKGKSCLYVKKLEDIDIKILKELVTKSVKHMQKSNS
jgi:hypothetical protein